MSALKDLDHEAVIDYLSDVCILQPNPDTPFNGLLWVSNDEYTSGPEILG